MAKSKKSKVPKVPKVPEVPKVQVARSRPWVVIWTALWVILLGLIVRRVLEMRNAPPKPDYWHARSVDTRWGRTIDPNLGYRPGVANCNLTSVERIARDKHIAQIKEEKRIAFRERQERDLRTRPVVRDWAELGDESKMLERVKDWPKRVTPSDFRPVRFSGQSMRLHLPNAR